MELESLRSSVRFQLCGSGGPSPLDTLKNLDSDCNQQSSPPASVHLFVSTTGCTRDSAERWSVFSIGQCPAKDSAERETPLFQIVRIFHDYCQAFGRKRPLEILPNFDLETSEDMLIRSTQ